jgi:hypothetical protein
MTTSPFYAGCPRFAEYGGTLILHTSRLRYTSEDGLNHQSNLTVALNTNSMQLLEVSASFPVNHVSHSFNQFVLFDGGQPVFLDHGDAYPRSVVLQKGSIVTAYPNPASGAEIANPTSGFDEGSPESTPSENTDQYAPSGIFFQISDEINLFPIPGPVGENYTGVSVGGFEASDTSYIAAISTVHSDGTTDSSSSGPAKRNVVLCVLPKDGSRDSDVKQITLGQYAGTDQYASTPYLVKMSGDRFAVLWQEFSTEYSLRGDMVCALVNGGGEPGCRRKHHLVQRLKPGERRPRAEGVYPD